jgi:hypothetical protein
MVVHPPNKLDNQGTKALSLISWTHPRRKKIRENVPSVPVFVFPGLRPRPPRRINAYSRSFARLTPPQQGYGYDCNKQDNKRIKFISKIFFQRKEHHYQHGYVS